MSSADVDSPVVRRSFVIQNKLGLHARALTELVNRARCFTAELWIEKDGQRVNGKTSILGLLVLGAGQGSSIECEAIGDDAEALLDAIDELISSKFGESE